MLKKLSTFEIQTAWFRGQDKYASEGIMGFCHQVAELCGFKVLEKLQIKALFSSGNQQAWQ